MQRSVDRLNSVLYGWRDRVNSVLQVVISLNAIFTISILVYRYGFWFEEDNDFRQVFNILDYSFIFFVIASFINFLFEQKRITYLRHNAFEAVLVLGAILYLSFGQSFCGKVLISTGWYTAHDALFAVQHFLSAYLLIILGLELTQFSTRISELNLKPASTFIFSFIFLIFAGTFLLMLPAMTHGIPTEGISKYDSISFVDALFTSVSASCVTGLAVVDTSSFFTLKGQLVIMFLAQLGGIGIVSFATFFASFLAKGVGLKHQSIIQDFLSSETLSSTTSLLRKVIVITILIEFVGFIFIFFSWGNSYQFSSLGQKVFFSAFHAVSAFCNAGFSLFPDGLATNNIENPNKVHTMVFHNHTSGLRIHKMFTLHFVISVIIILGGIGFNTIEDIYSKLTWKRIKDGTWAQWKISTRVAIYSTMLLIGIGVFGFMVLEFEQLRDRTLVEALDTALFQSVTTRTAGFNTMDFSTLREPTLILVIVLMFIGAAPGSTGGGIKNSTFYVIILSSIANIRGYERIELGKRTIPGDIILKAFSIFLFAIVYNSIAIFLLTITESGNDFGLMKIAFEQVSAFSTTGLSMGITNSLSTAGKIVIIVSMYIGRVGTLTLALALSNKVSTNSYRYPEGHVMVG